MPGFVPRVLRRAPVPSAADPVRIVAAEVARDASTLAEMARRLGYRVVGSADTADEALALVRCHEPDVVLVGLVLRGARDGIWLGRVLREELGVPFVYATRFSDRKTLAEACRTRPSGYLVRPFTPEAAYAAIETALAGRAECAPAERRAAPGLPLRALRAVQDHVDRHLDAPIPMARLAAVAGLSPYHFARCFRAATGRSPCQYVATRRVEEARRLLLCTDWPVARVALAVGYESPSHFSGLFKRHVGQTPGAFRAAG